MKPVIELRPQRPPIAEIIADLESASADDVVFGLLDTSDLMDDKSNSSSVATEDSFLNDSDTPDSNANDSTTFDNQENLEVNANYSKVLNFLELYCSLKECPPELRQQVNELQTLSSEVSQSIANLKEKSETLSPFQNGLDGK
ncbi:uncharacterized protein LOC115209410 [Octopus sinensis]|uniref:Uncharacterized protein LOC115209410 n=1 Tax=Octopus sinensis TaxID=2607531 RepID=A0A6P7S6A1_9MOLL|nr:uncharacterized protein LOC115209410 [Octopus sinensis]